MVEILKTQVKLRDQTNKVRKFATNGKDTVTYEKRFLTMNNETHLKP
jgi:hypothetical protein